MLPKLQAAWLAQFLGAPIPAESNATCEACAMVADKAEGGASLEQGFNPETKCCTYMPQLWNFLVGGVLGDQDVDARGRASVEARIDHGIATPLGLGRTRTYHVLYKSGTLRFGQSRELLCPHYLPEGGGRCSVWGHRESACSTWFCKFERGAIGFDFWSHLNQMLGTAERVLAGWALLELGLDGSALARLYAPRRDSDPSSPTGRDVYAPTDPAEVRAVWGAWHRRERELYRECAQLVAPLRWTDVLRIGGAELSVYARLVEEAYARLMNRTPPERPTTALVQITPRGKARVRLATYHGRDALEVPAIVGTILPHFDGRPISAAIAEIRAKEGVAIDPSLVRKLADFGVLRDAQPVGEA
jgi:hypothetical protein